MRFNGIVITEETDPGQVYENPVHVLSRNKKKSKEDFKTFWESNWVLTNKHGYAITKVCPSYGNYEVFSCSG